MISRLFKKLRPKDNNVKRLKEKGLLEVGRGTYGSINIERYEGSDAKVVIGRYCSISKGVRFITGGIHPPDWVSTYPFRIKFKKPTAYCDGLPSTNGPIAVGSDVWIGTDALILSGVSIGHGAIIAARAVVTHNVAPYTLVAGVPASVVRERFDRQTIDALLDVSWWDWPEDEIDRAIPLLSSSNIDAFLSEYGVSESN